MMNEPPRGRPVAVDRSAISACPTEPAFIAPPSGAPVYYGFLVLDDLVVDGFTLGKITDFEAEPCDVGDAFVIAPDGSRAGLVWEVADDRHFQEARAPEEERWGVWDVAMPFPMTSRENARKNLAAILPELKLRWTEWKSNFAE